MRSSPLTSLTDAALSLRWERGNGATFRPGDALSLPVFIANDGVEPVQWSAGRPLNLSYRWLDEAGTVIVADGVRTILPGTSIAPGERLEIKLKGRAPAEKGHYSLIVSLVLEGVHWACEVAPQGWASSEVIVATPPAWPAHLLDSPGARALRGALLACELARNFEESPFVEVHSAPAVAEAESGGDRVRAVAAGGAFAALRRALRRWIDIKPRARSSGTH